MIRKSAVRIGVLWGVAAALVLLGACNTVEGVGKDIKATGGAIENAADRDD
jgi:predicted small secreted protein